MKICLVSIGIPPEDGGGIGTYVWSLAKGLAENGHLVHIVTPGASQTDSVYTIEGITVHRYCRRVLSKGERFCPGLIWSYFIARQISALDKEINLDLIEFPNWEGCGFVYNLFFRRKPTVVRFHTPYFETLEIDQKGKGAFADRFICWMEYWAAKKAMALSCSTKNHAHMMSGVYSIPEASIAIIPLGIKLPQIRDINADEVKVPVDEKTVLYVSRLEHRKGTLTLLEAIPLVIEQVPNARFVFIGRDRPHAPGNMCFKDYFFLTFSMYKDHVQFRGYVTDDELKEWYNRCDIFVVPSRYESFGLIYIEAMAYGKPVIACNAGGIPEVVSDGRTGFLVSPGDHTSLSTRIVELLTDDSLRHSMGEIALADVHERFACEKMVEKTLNYYKKVVSLGDASV